MIFMPLAACPIFNDLQHDGNGLPAFYSLSHEETHNLPSILLAPLEPYHWYKKREFGMN